MAEPLRTRDVTIDVGPNYPKGRTVALSLPQVHETTVPFRARLRPGEEARVPFVAPTPGGAQPGRLVLSAKAVQP